MSYGIYCRCDRCDESIQDEAHVYCERCFNGVKGEEHIEVLKKHIEWLNAEIRRLKNKTKEGVLYG